MSDIAAAASSSSAPAGDTAAAAPAAASGGSPPPISSDASTNLPSADALSPGRATSFRDALRQAPEAAGSDGDLLPQGPIPFDRHKDILEKARTDTRAKLIAEYPGLGEQVTPQTYGQLVALRDRLQQQGPMGFLSDLMSEMMASPQHAPLVQAWLAQQVGGNGNGNGHAPAQPQERPALPDRPPGPDTEQGYSQQGFDRVIDWIEQRMAAQLDPVREETTRLRQERERVAKFHQDEQYATSLFQKISKLPHYEAAKGEMAKRFASMPWSAATPNAEIEAALYRLYAEVMGETVLPGLTKSAQTDYRQQLDSKARATTTTPGSRQAATPVPAKPLSFRDELKRSATAR